MKQLTFMAPRFVLPLPMRLRKLEQTPLNGIAWTRQAPCFCNHSRGRDALIATGYDLSRVDFALPQAWVDENCEGRDTFRPEYWLLDYSNSSTIGEPLSVGGWKRLISLQVLALLVEG
ncbi:MAG: hypothetical protein IMY80_01790 [Chloroflexi bacterium]|nr:hypothetical protein [Chloroflexota bacterium]